MTRLLYLPDDATIIHLDVDVPSRQLAAAVNAGLDPLPGVFIKGQRYTARLVGNTVIIFPYRKRERTAQDFDSKVLTNQQRRVMELAMKGLTNIEIAERLGISRRTVTYHMRGIRERIQMESLSTTLIEVKNRQD
jgi:DNA-binding CsgD family transcriptional regulator